MDLSLWNFFDIVVWRVGGLLREEQKDSLEHLIAVESCDGHVEEQTVQDSLGNVLENVLQECECDS